MKFKILSLCMALAMAFSCAFGLTACNKEITVKSVEISADGELIITMTDGSKKSLGSVKGEDGKDGAGVADAYIDDDGNLIIELTTGEKLNCGTVTATDDYYFSVVKENGEVTGYSVAGLAKATVTNVSIPSSYKNLPVVGIAEEAFAGCGEIVSVTVPNSVKTIGARAFADCAKLESVSFGNGLEEVGRAAFARCEELTKVNISDIGAWCEIAFESPASNPLYFAHKLYLNNTLLSDIKIPDTVTAIGGFAFYGCDNIVSVDTGNGVKTVGERAFFECTALNSLTFGENAEAIGEQAFSDCTALRTLNLGNSLKSIGDYAFNRCSALTDITIPSSVETIGECSFAECSELKDLTLNYGLKTIGRGAFCGCFSLEKFIMPDSVTFIDYGILLNEQGIGFVPAEGEQGNLSEIRISNSLTEISDYAFSKCFIRNIEIGSKVEKINYSSFYGCIFLESMVIPVSVKHISSYAFYECGALQTVFYMGTPDEWSRVFIGRNGNNDLREATVYYYSEQAPEQDGTYWRYVNGVPTVWEN